MTQIKEGNRKELQIFIETFVNLQHNLYYFRKYPINTEVGIWHAFDKLILTF